MESLYLVQHGKAFDEKIDPERSLTPEGVSETNAVASYLAKVGASVDSIVHSGKRRALQTAEIMARYLGVKSVNAIGGLNPNDDPSLIASKLSELGSRVMIIGHLPHLSKLASLLIIGNPNAQLIKFRYSGVVKLGLSNGQWVIEWYITPELIRQ